MYCDRDYVFLNVPDFLDGVDFIRTANGDKRSDPTDEQFLCFVLTAPATVYGACCTCFWCAWMTLTTFINQCALGCHGSALR